jgi:hypothetical protein
MRTDPQAGWTGALRWPRPRIRLGRPAGIRNGGLLLVLVALAAVTALVERPPQPQDGRSLPWVFQHLPPPVGIRGLPPVAEQPPAPPATGPAGPDGSGGRPASGDRAHPGRQHPRPSRSPASGLRAGSAAGQAGGGQGATGTTRPPPRRPPGSDTASGATPSVARVTVPPVQVRVRPPALLGRDLPRAGAKTPGVTVTVPAAESTRVGLG